MKCLKTEPGIEVHRRRPEGCGSAINAGLETEHRMGRIGLNPVRIGVNVSIQTARR
jgi:hypothetical protein